MLLLCVDAKTLLVSKKAISSWPLFSRNHFRWKMFLLKLYTIPEPFHTYLYSSVQHTMHSVFQNEHLLSRLKQPKIFWISLLFRYVHQTIVCVCVCICMGCCLWVSVLLCVFCFAGFAYCYNHNNCYLLWLLFHLLLLDVILLFCCCSNCQTTFNSIALFSFSPFTIRLIPILVIVCIGTEKARTKTRIISFAMRDWRRMKWKWSIWSQPKNQIEIQTIFSTTDVDDFNCSMYILMPYTYPLYRWNFNSPYSNWCWS